MSGHHLPEGILLDICLRLPVKAIGRFRCVNKSLCSLLQSPNFIQMHLNHSTEKDKFKLLISSYSDGQSSVHSMASRSDSSLLLSDYESVEIDYPFKSQNPLVEIIGSCNGLVCLELNRRDVCIWNPSTTEFKKIQTPPTVFKVLDVAHRRGQKGYSYGFGYDSKIGDYKLVRYERCEYVMYLSSGSIYTLGTDTWKKIESRALSLYDVSFADKSGVHVNGVLYWIAARTLEKGDGFKSCLVIVSFNICGESGHEIQLPADISAGQVALSLSMFDGNLCLICDILDVHVEVWVMKDFGEDKARERES
ncbi:F-box/kelch-repeat protein At3g06240-like [Papaver somniferum]|uniref:F-box/kelch-repeat protein At3g06240-like n=1 Tax=Papaver somniferum TaxID=3469 RepID=UPI000E70263A|nr:F-box/kelch-repeat protein At3g06240-like [Papaver somniferum]